ncbi:MAG: endonuclease domain-containing protein [Opitutaceae bacterium]|nr:endonuclease domain-containing protein [Cytophagales bacterium]
MKLNNLPKLKDKRLQLRKTLTPAEAKLWTLLKNNQLEGRKFRRQHSVGNYIIDFYCPSEKLAIELDGAGHFTEEGMAYDEERTEVLNSIGIKVIRFENETVFKFLDHVLEEIKRNFKI